MMDAPTAGPAVICTNCGSGEVSLTHVRSAFWEGERLVVVEGIPMLVCAGCAERFYPDRTAIALDLLRSEGFPADKARAEMRVPVFSYVDPAAKSAS